jgi:hypothetical protein
MIIDDIICKTLSEPVHNPTQDRRPLVEWLRETLIDGGLGADLADSVVDAIDADWIVADVVRPSFDVALRAARADGMLALDRIAERRFGSSKSMFALIEAAEWDAFIATAGDEVHLIVAQIAILIVDSFLVSTDEAAAGDMSISTYERKALALLGARYGSDRGKRIAARQRSLGAENAPIPPNAIIAQVASMAMMPQESFVFDESADAKKDLAHAYITPIARIGADASRVVVRVQRPTILRKASESEPKDAPLMEAVHAKLAESFASAYVMDFFLSILIALLRKIEIAKARREASDPEGAWYTLDWKEIDTVGGFSTRDIQDEQKNKIRRELRSFCHCLDGIRASGIDRDGCAIDNYLMKTKRVVGASGEVGPFCMFGRGEFSLGPALMSWIYGDERRDAHFSLLEYGKLKRSGISPVRHTVFLRQRMLAAAITGRANAAHMQAADATANVAAGACVDDGKGIDPTVPVVRFSLADLAGLGFHLLQPERSSVNAAVIASKERAKHLVALKEILADLQGIGIISGYTIFGERSHDRLLGPIQCQPIHAPVVFVRPHPDSLRQRMFLADASAPAAKKGAKR